MTFLLLVLFFEFTLLTNAQYEFLQYLISDTTKQLLTCNIKGHDFEVDIMVQIQDHHSELWIKYWDCFGSSIPQVHDAIIILNQIQPFQWYEILQKKNIQLSLSSNFWVIYVTQSEVSITSYFIQKILKIGIDAGILFIKKTPDKKEVITQVIGKGTFETEYKVSLKYYIKLNQIAIIKKMIIGN